MNYKNLLKMYSFEFNLKKRYYLLVPLYKRFLFLQIIILDNLADFSATEESLVVEYVWKI